MTGKCLFNDFRMIPVIVDDVRREILDFLSTIAFSRRDPSVATDREVVLRKLFSIRGKLRSILREKKRLRVLVPVFPMRQWMLASINESIRRMGKLERGAASGTSFWDDVEVIALWAYQAVSIFDARALFQDILNHDSNYAIDRNLLKHGDIVLSYKTKKYLRKDILARLVSMATNSPITHSLIVSTSGSKPLLLCSSPEGNGPNFLEPCPSPGEVYIVMRLRDMAFPFGDHIKKIVDMRNIGLADGCPVNAYKFAELKSWVASAIGFIYVLSTYLFRRPIVFPNIVKSDNGVFCSELIDNVFREAGFFMTPRSENPSVVGPVEIFYSPYLSFQGIIMNEDDRGSMREELTRKFNLR